jgi:hypothetical protein
MASSVFGWKVRASERSADALLVIFAHMSDLCWAVRSLVVSLKPGASTVSYDQPLLCRLTLKEGGRQNRGHEKLFAEALACKFRWEGRAFSYHWWTLALASGSQADVLPSVEVLNGETFTCKPDA